MMCILWKARQRRLGIDDFGNPLLPGVVVVNRSEDDVPGLVVEDEDPVAVHAALVNALESAVEADVRTGGIIESQRVEEDTPLLGGTASKNRRWWEN